MIFFNRQSDSFSIIGYQVFSINRLLCLMFFFLLSRDQRETPENIKKKRVKTQGIVINGLGWALAQIKILSIFFY
jgi:hypothetical protein